MYYVFLQVPLFLFPMRLWQWQRRPSLCGGGADHRRTSHRLTSSCESAAFYMRSTVAHDARASLYNVSCYETFAKLLIRYQRSSQTYTAKQNICLIWSFARFTCIHNFECLCESNWSSVLLCIYLSVVVIINIPMSTQTVKYWCWRVILSNVQYNIIKLLELYNLHSVFILLNQSYVPYCLYCIWDMFLLLVSILDSVRL